MVKVKILDKLKYHPDSWITRVLFYKSNGGSLYVQERRFPCEGVRKESQTTIPLGDSLEEIRELRDFLNSLNLDGVND